MQQSINYNNHIETFPILYMLKYIDIDRIMKDYYREEKDTVNIYLDLRGAVNKIYEEEVKIDLVKSYNVRNDKFVIARSVIKLINHWARYLKKNNIHHNFIIFSESGDSLYHKKIDSNYKNLRKQSKLKAVSYNQNLLDNASTIIDYNIKTLEKVLNNINDVYYIHLDYLEADFIPQYIMNTFGLNTDNNLNIILSNDKDLGQIVNKNTIQIAYKSKGYVPFDNSNVVELLKGSVKTVNVDSTFASGKFFSILLAMIGDKSDGVEGLKMVGFGKAYPYLLNLFNKGLDLKNDNNMTMKYLIEFIEESLKLEDSLSKNLIENKQRMLDSYKLVDFDELINDLGYNYSEKIRSIIERTKEYSLTNDKTIIYNTLLTICGDQTFFSSLNINPLN